MSKAVKIFFALNNQNFKKVIQCSKSEVQNGELATIFDIEQFKKNIRKIHISGDVVDYDELCKMITESFNVRIYKRAYIIECEMEIEIETSLPELIKIENGIIVEKEIELKVEQILDGKEMLVSELISKLESKLQDYDVVETTETVVEFVAKNYDEEQDGNFERKEYKTIKKTLVKKVAKIEITEQKETIYHNENSDWYLINDNYKDAETIKEEEIDLTQYKIVKIESSETGNDEVDEGFWVWECQDGVFYLEEEGCFKKFESLEKLLKQFEFDKNLRQEELEYYDFNANVDYDEFM